MRTAERVGKVLGYMLAGLIVGTVLLALAFLVSWPVRALLDGDPGRPLEHHVLLTDGSRQVCLDFGEWGSCQAEPAG